MSEAERLERLEKALERLRETAAGQVVLVEGPHDRAALEELGVGGEHVQLNQGMGVEAFMDRVAEDAGGRRVVLLMDWDRTGGRLAQRLEEGLRARVPVETLPRRWLSSVCHVKSVEEVPGELAALRRAVAPRGGPMRKP